MSRTRRTCRPVFLLFVFSYDLTACSEKTENGRSVSATSPGCVRTDSGATGTRASDSTAVTEDVRAGRTYSCVFAPGEPAVRVALIADSAENQISRIELRGVSDAPPIQTLTEGQTESPYRGADVFAARDLDHDGHLDLMLLSEWGATGNSFYHVWRWNAADRRFAFDSTLSALASLTPLPDRPCVTSKMPRTTPAALPLPSLSLSQSKLRCRLMRK
jgi:hypothetical protein